MSQITKVEFWKDTGFQEGAIEVPSVNDVLPTADYTFEEAIKTSTEDFFSAFTIPGPFLGYLNMSYVRLTYEFNNTYTESTDPQFRTLVIYGWIDSIALKSDSDGNPSITVNWHIDHWRTYLGSARFGYGLVQSRPASKNDPPQSLSYRYRRPSEFTSMKFNGHGNEANWLIINHTKETGESTLTEVRTAIIPVSKDANTRLYYKDGDTTIPCPKLGDVINGSYDEALEMSPSAITSVFLSPVPPIRILSGTGTQSDPYVLDKGTSESSTETVDIPLNCTEKLILRYTLETTHCNVEYTDGSSITIPYASPTWQSFYLNIMTALRNTHGRYFTTSRKYSNNRTMSIRCSVNDVTAPIMVARWMKLDDLINEAKSGQFEDDPVVGDSVVFTSGNVYSVASEPTLEITHTTQDSYAGNFDYIDVKYSYGTRTPVTGTEFAYDGSTFGNVWILADDLETISLTYQQKVSSLKFQVELDSNGYAYSKNQNYYEYSQELPHMIMTTDTKEWIFTDMMGIPIGTIPWGIECRQYTVRNIISSSSAYLEYRFDEIDSHTLGTSFTVPLPAVDLTSNSWSDYVYSGQRDYDITQRKIASQQALVSGIASSVTGASSNAIMASIGYDKKSYAVDPNNPRTKMAGDYLNRQLGQSVPKGAIQNVASTRGMNPLTAAGATIGIGVATSLVEYAISQYFNGQLQKAEDMLQAKQIDSILMSGNGWDWLWNGRPCGFISLVADNYSLDRFKADKRLNGIYCSEPTEDCDSIRTSEGPYQVAELIVTGDIPIEARAYIRGRFANGVRIRTINTETATE